MITLKFPAAVLYRRRHGTSNLLFKTHTPHIDAHASCYLPNKYVLGNLNLQSNNFPIVYCVLSIVYIKLMYSFCSLKYVYSIKNVCHAHKININRSYFIFRNDYLFWSDVRLDQISRSHMNGSNVQILVRTGIKNPGIYVVIEQDIFLPHTPMGTLRILITLYVC